MAVRSDSSIFSRLVHLHQTPGASGHRKAPIFRIEYSVWRNRFKRLRAREEAVHSSGRKEICGFCFKGAGMKGREVVALALVAVLVAAGHLGPVEGQSTLTSTFYATSCPNADQLVRDSMGTTMNSSQIVGPSVLRLFAHDCFVGVSFSRSLLNVSVLRVTSVPATQLPGSATSLVRRACCPSLVKEEPSCSSCPLVTLLRQEASSTPRMPQI